MIGVEQESDQERRFFFAHVQKAAGTSLFVRMQRHFSRPQIYPNDSDLGGEVTVVGAQADDGARPTLPRLAATLLVSHLRERYRIRRAEIRVVAGHFPLRTTELLGDEFTTLTLVREPVARTLSALRHQQMKAPTDRDRPLEELYDDPIRFHGLIHNHMVKVFSLSPEELATGDGVMARVEDFTPARLEEAKTRLAGVDVLGLHDDLDGFCTVLTDRFGWQLGAGVHANRTDPIEVPRSFRERIARDNAADAELYDYARELYARRGALSTARGA